MLTVKELAIRQKLKDDFVHYGDRCLKVRTKAGKLLPLRLNFSQQYVHNQLETQLRDTGRVRAIILKGRQMGMSTMIEARFFWKVTHRTGVRAFILTHEIEATNNLFEMAQRYQNNVPDIIRPVVGASNARELFFAKLDSGYKVGTAGTKGVGRSQTIQYLHGSEVAFWPHADEHAKGILQAVPDEDGTEVILESTANGVGNYFHAQWQAAERGDSEFNPIFVPWYWEPEYRLPVKDEAEFELTDQEKDIKEIYSLSDDQLNWRRRKIAQLTVGGVDGEVAFAQEYPNTSMEAFTANVDDVYIQSADVMKVRGKGKGISKVGPKIVGVDPARFGDNKTSIIRRQGRVAWGKQSYKGKSTMEVAGLVYRIIRDESPDKIFVDVSGLGAGVVDRLHEMGFKGLVVPVNGGERALESDRYANRRAEMWGNMKEWLLDTPCGIPDSDSLHSDLCGPKYKFDSKSRLMLEKKEDMKKRGVESPDEGDALALTFAEPVRKRKIIQRTAHVIADSIAGY